MRRKNLKIKNLKIRVLELDMFLCSGAGSSPILLSSLGYNHKGWVLLKFIQQQGFH